MQSFQETVLLSLGASYPCHPGKKQSSSDKNRNISKNGIILWFRTGKATPYGATPQKSCRGLRCAPSSGSFSRHCAALHSGFCCVILRLVNNL